MTVTLPTIEVDIASGTASRTETGLSKPAAPAPLSLEIDLFTINRQNDPLTLRQGERHLKSVLTEAAASVPKKAEA